MFIMLFLLGGGLEGVLGSLPRWAAAKRAACNKGGMIYYTILYYTIPYRAILYYTTTMKYNKLLSYTIPTPATPPPSRLGCASMLRAEGPIQPVESISIIRNIVINNIIINNIMIKNINMLQLRPLKGYS